MQRHNQALDETTLHATLKDEKRALPQEKMRRSKLPAETKKMVQKSPN